MNTSPMRKCVRWMDLREWCAGGRIRESPQIIPLFPSTQGLQKYNKPSNEGQSQACRIPGFVNNSK